MNGCGPIVCYRCFIFHNRNRYISSTWFAVASGDVDNYLARLVPLRVIGRTPLSFLSHLKG